MSEPQAFQRIPLNIVFKDDSAFKENYGGSVGLIALTAQHLKPERPSDTILVTMHPIGGTATLPVMRWFAEAGIHLLACDSRYRGADYALIMEKVVTDLGAAVRYARERLGYKRVVLLGWSGGGSLSAFYQAQAENPTITQTPAGDPVDLAAAKLIPADAVVFVAAHVSRHSILTDALDASILDEANPDNRTVDLDLYGALQRPPYTTEFLKRYRSEQQARNRRITAWVHSKLQALREAGRAHEEFAFVTHGTMADPRWLDPSVDPNGRPANWCYMGDPRIVNMSPIGFARYSSLRSWLSQWSLDDAQDDGPASIAKTSVPVLVINNGADDACAPSHAQRLFDAVTHDDKAFVEIDGANHYYQGQPELGARAVSEVANWLASHGLHLAPST
jgi:alpha-beta hydrolase superfamily lysophospholipase